ncbi:Crp-Fnr family transciptional regulator [Oceanicola granulosus HTCC2516]|uniref:Crp-Fnr family transciptional regulator n=1 Tax=Oceanicola granulosus (strain ATCC BAA-861 / DSM 15982 / KCTC 12143 / HTCC2516) TaxID=314256 RepID=Q2CIT7_OCEGH|nr:Crp/Fnr family transcriptional regulator [Oceanicola granulosus]EAR52502.1 Crp-Fnr family transciptional regulator [Oceanicola granulosus HTCC2516]
MPVPCRNCPLRRCDIFAPVTEQELAFLQRFKSGELKVAPGMQLLMEGSNSPQLYTVLAGQGLRYKTFASGRRQVLNFVFPGDFLGLQAGMMGEMHHSVEATTEMVLCVFDRKEFFNIFRHHPERAYDITWLAATEEHFLGETLATVGQLPAVARMAWALMRLFNRAEALGMTTGDSFPMPYRQQDLADALGLSLVHTNKTLARLRDHQIASWHDGHIKIHSHAGLAESAGEEAGESAWMTRPLI